MHPLISNRWEEQRALDEVVAAVREGDLNRVIAMVKSPPFLSHFQGARALFANFVGLLIRSGHGAMVEYALRILLENPDLANQTYTGRTLLGTSHGPTQPLIVSCTRFRSPLFRHLFLSHSTGTAGRPRSVLPQQQPLQTVTWPMTRRLVSTG